MSILDKIKKGTADRPNRILLYGVEKIGKSTWASQSEKPVFACTEDGLGPELQSVPRIMIERYEDLLSLISDLVAETHDYRTLVIDTIDNLEALMHTYVCTRDSKADIDAYGYQKGQRTVIPNELRKLLSLLDRLIVTKGMDIIVIGHSTIKNFNDPTSEGYDRYVLKGDQNYIGLINAWSDAILFARQEVYVKRAKGATKGKAIGESCAIMHTRWSAAWDAGNKIGLPDTLPLNYDAFKEAMKASSHGNTNQTRELAELILALFESAEWPNPELAAKVAQRLGGKMTVEALAKRPAKELQPAADYLRTLQPAPKEDVA